MIRRPPRSPLFPYPPLFRSQSWSPRGSDTPAEPAAPARTSPSPQRQQGHPLLALRARSVSAAPRSEEHTSELQSRSDLVCRLLLEKKKTKKRSRICIQFDDT